MDRAFQQVGGGSRKETFLKEKESFPPHHLESLAKECLRCPLARQKEVATFLDVSQGQVAKWTSRERIPIVRSFQIIQNWIGLRKTRVNPIEEKIESLLKKFVSTNLDLSENTASEDFKHQVSWQALEEIFQKWHEIPPEREFLQVLLMTRDFWTSIASRYERLFLKEKES